jgi:cellobiose phosphorylase
VDWKGFTFHYRYRETLYHIAILQTRAGNGDTNVTVDGVEQHDEAILLVGDHQEHSVKVHVRLAVTNLE